MSDFSYGPHLTIDAYGCDKARLGSLDCAFELLHDLPGRIGMVRITQPYVFPYAASDPRDGGVTGFVVIAESHISVHTYPERGVVFVDVFSCRPFDTDAAKALICEAFGASGQVDSNVVRRGVRFHQEG